MPNTNKNTLRAQFLKMFDTSQGQGEQAYVDKSVSLGLTQEYSSQELRTLTQRQYVEPDANRNVHPDSFEQILNTLNVSHREIVNNIADAERLKALDPKIKQVESIIVSSIMSPNDLQDVDPEIVIDSEEVPDGQKQKISTVLSKFFCNTYKIREKMVRWIKEAHFRSGAGTGMILPEATLTDLINTYDPNRAAIRAKGTESLCRKIGTESLTTSELTQVKDIVYSDDFYQRVLEHTPFSGKKNTNHRTGLEGIYLGPEPHPSYIDPHHESDLATYIERFLNEETESQFISNENKAILAKGIENLSISFKKAFSDRNSDLKISENPEILRFGKAYRKHTSDSITSKMSPILGRLMEQKEKDAEANYYKDIKALDLTLHMTDFSQQQAFPFYLDLPAEALIPIGSACDKSQHLGYFLLVDSYGQPIEASAYLVDSNSCSVSGRINTAYQAIYGEMPTDSGIYGSRGISGIAARRMEDYKKTSVNKVFNYVLDNLLKRKLQDMGLNDVTLGRYNTIAQCMFQRLLEKKKTALVFIPEKYVMYLAFDYHRTDGTGKSKIEDILYMESLKVSFLTANTLATMKSAVPMKKVKLNLDEKQTNVLETTFMLRDKLIQKEKFLPSTHPSTIANQILAQNLSIETVHPHASNFSYTVEDTHREIPKADTDFFEMLDQNTVIGLGLAPSALSELSEVQFARSLATTNLNYAKSIRQDQVVVEDKVSAHIQNYTALSSVLIYKIAQILDSDDLDRDPLTRDRKNNKDLTEIKPTEENNLTGVGMISKKISDETFEKVINVINCIRIRLCPPNVAPDSTQYTLLSDILKSIEDYINVMLPDDFGTFTGDDNTANDYKLVKAHIKSILAREAAEHLGFNGLITKIPQLEEYSLESSSDLTKIYSVLKNISEDIARTVQAGQKKAPEDAGSDDSTSSSSGSLW